MAYLSAQHRRVQVRRSLPRNALMHGPPQQFPDESDAPWYLFQHLTSDDRTSLPGKFSNTVLLRPPRATQTGKARPSRRRCRKLAYPAHAKYWYGRRGGLRGLLSTSNYACSNSVFPRLCFPAEALWTYHLFVLEVIVTSSHSVQFASGRTLRWLAVLLRVECPFHQLRLQFSRGTRTRSIGLSADNP